MSIPPFMIGIAGTHSTGKSTFVSKAAEAVAAKGLRVGRISRGMTAMPTRASFQLMENRATRVVTTVAVLLTMLDRVPLMTELTPLMSVFMRVMMSPCFSVVKKEWGIYCRWRYIWFFMSKMMRWEIHELM